MSSYVQGALGRVQARSEFRRAHTAARARGLVSRLLRRCYRLCTIADALPELTDSRASDRRPALVRGVRRLTEVPIDRIVGSLDRAEDFTPGFLPLVGGDEERWVNVYLALEGQEGLPPVELVELDGEYYVEDGHHRVSVLRRMRVKAVEAYVTPLRAV